MREYFLDLLNDLDKLAGLKQLDKIYAAAGDDRGAAITEINRLLNVLCKVSEMFPLIPEADQQKIITQAVTTEDPKEYHSLNGNIVYKWLARHKDKYSQVAKAEPEKPAGPPLTGEARMAQIKKFLDELAKVDDLNVSHKKIDAPVEGKEWVSEVERKAVSTKIDPDRHIYTPETLKERNERIRVMQEKAFRDRNPGASEEEVKLFMESIKKHEVKIPTNGK
jgi:hypothetical protein